MKFSWFVGVGAFLCAISATCADTPPQPAKSPDATVYRSVNDVLGKLPKELQPVSKVGWDQFSIVNVQDWLGAHLVGAKVEAIVHVHGITIESNEGATPDHRWQVTINGSADIQTASVKGIVLRSFVCHPDLSDVVEVFEVNEVTARNWQNKKKELIRAGQELPALDGKASGVVQKAEIRGLGNNNLNRREVFLLTLQLDDMVAVIPGLSTTPAGPADAGVPRPPNQPAQKNAADKGNAAKTPLVTYKALSEVLSKFPKELSPTQNDGWDKFTLPKVQDWLDTNVVGSKLEAEPQLIKIGVEPREGSDPNHKWSVTVSLDANIKTARVGRIVIASDVSGPAWAGELEWDVDEATAKMWQKKSNAHAPSGGKVSGTISSITITPTRGGYLLNFQLDDLVIDLPGLTRKSDATPGEASH